MAPYYHRPGGWHSYRNDWRPNSPPPPPPLCRYCDTRHTGFCRPLPPPPHNQTHYYHHHSGPARRSSPPASSRGRGRWNYSGANRRHRRPTTPPRAHPYWNSHSTDVRSGNKIRSSSPSSRRKVKNQENDADDQATKSHPRTPKPRLPAQMGDSGKKDEEEADEQEAGEVMDEEDDDEDKVIAFKCTACNALFHTLEQKEAHDQRKHSAKATKRRKRNDRKLLEKNKEKMAEIKIEEGEVRVADGEQEKGKVIKKEKNEGKGKSQNKPEERLEAREKEKVKKQAKKDDKVELMKKKADTVEGNPELGLGKKQSRKAQEKEKAKAKANKDKTGQVEGNSQKQSKTTKIQTDKSCIKVKVKYGNDPNIKTEDTENNPVPKTTSETTAAPIYEPANPVSLASTVLDTISPLTAAPKPANLPISPPAPPSPPPTPFNPPKGPKNQPQHQHSLTTHTQFRLPTTNPPPPTPSFTIPVTPWLVCLVEGCRNVCATPDAEAAHRKSSHPQCPHCRRPPLWFLDDEALKKHMNKRHGKSQCVVEGCTDPWYWIGTGEKHKYAMGHVKCKYEGCQGGWFMDAVALQRHVGEEHRVEELRALLVRRKEGREKKTSNEGKSDVTPTVDEDVVMAGTGVENQPPKQRQKNGGLPPGATRLPTSFITANPQYGIGGLPPPFPPPPLQTRNRFSSNNGVNDNTMLMMNPPLPFPPAMTSMFDSFPQQQFPFLPPPPPAAMMNFIQNMAVMNAESWPQWMPNQQPLPHPQGHQQHQRHRQQGRQGHQQAPPTQKQPPPMITDTSVPTQISSRLETELSAGRLTRAQGPCWFIDEHGDPSLIDETFSPPFPLKNSDKPESKEALPPALPSIENGGEAGASSSSSKEGGNQEQAGKEVLGKGSGMKRTAEEAGMDWGKNEKDGDELWQCPHPSCSGAFESPVGLKRHFMERSCEVNGRDVLLRMVERIEEERGEKEAGRLRRNRI